MRFQRVALGLLPFAEVEHHHGSANRDPDAEQHGTKSTRGASPFFELRA
jgi:hypothetical protein